MLHINMRINMVYLEYATSVYLNNTCTVEPQIFILIQLLTISRSIAKKPAERSYICTTRSSRDKE